MTLLSWFRGTVPPRCYPIAKRRQTLGGENSDTARSTKVSTIQRVWKKSGKFYVFSKLDPAWRIFQRKFFEYNAAFEWIFIGSRVE